MMKLAIAVAGKDAPHNAFVVWRGFEESIFKASDMGYNGIELALRDASEINAASLSGWLSRAGISVSAITTGQVFAVSGLYFTHHDPAVRKKTAETFMALADIAADFAPILNIGRARGFIEDGGSLSQAETLFSQSVEPVLEYAYKKNVTVVIEPVNRYEINFINSVADGMKLLESMNIRDCLRPFIGLMPDVYHMNIEDTRIGGSLRDAGELVKYVHLADSNRMAPGAGHLDFDEVFTALKYIGYDGWVSVEILPAPSPDSAASSAAEFLLPKVRAYNACE